MLSAWLTGPKVRVCCCPVPSLQPGHGVDGRVLMGWGCAKLRHVSRERTRPNFLTFWILLECCCGRNWSAQLSFNFLITTLTFSISVVYSVYSLHFWRHFQELEEAEGILAARCFPPDRSCGVINLPWPSNTDPPGNEHIMYPLVMSK